MAQVMANEPITAERSTPQLLGSYMMHLDSSPSKDDANETSNRGASDALPEGDLDVRRKAQIAFAGARDHAGEVVLLPNNGFDIDRTIFGTLDGRLPRAVLSSKVGITPFWSEAAAARIRNAFLSVPSAPRHDQGLLEFMRNDCNFAMEHADGSFMDHLRFCYEYSFAHYKEKSPRVLLLHSIMGVGTNYFPMEASKIPQLRALLTEFEFKQIAAFPSVLRLLYRGDLLRELEQLSKAGLNAMERIVFYRVIDNERIEMDSEAFWDQLNYQLIHLLDFLPAASWKLHTDDSFLRNFTALYTILVRAGRLRCNVNFDVTEAQSTATGQPPMSLGLLIRKVLPSSVVLKISENAIAKFSNKIGHSLDYQLHFQAKEVDAYPDVVHIASLPVSRL